MLASLEVMQCNYSYISAREEVQNTAAKMASNYKKEPIFVLERTWDDKTKMPEKNKFQGTDGKAEVHISSGALGMEFFLKKTLPQFYQAGSCLDWTWGELFSEFKKVLAECYKTTWLEVLHDHFPKPLEAETIITAPKQNCKVRSNFHLAINLFNNEGPEDTFLANHDPLDMDSE